MMKYADIFTDQDEREYYVQFVRGQDFLVSLFPYLKGLISYLDEKFLNHSPVFMLPDNTLNLIIFDSSSAFMQDVVCPWVYNWRRDEFISFEDDFFKDPIFWKAKDDAAGTSRHVLSIPMGTDELMVYSRVFDYFKSARAMGSDFMEYKGISPSDLFGIGSDNYEMK